MHVGIDEVGRGPLAGPVTLCACMVTANFDMTWFDGIKDSKKLSLKKRREWFTKADKARENGLMKWVVASRSAAEIDKEGIAVSIRTALGECLSALRCEPAQTKIFLDGSLRAPEKYINQETIIKGDEKIPLIGMASIIAKVTRDSHMDELAKIYPVYGFEKHKGYGTAFHQSALDKHGITPVHRKSFMKGRVV